VQLISRHFFICPLLVVFGLLTKLRKISALRGTYIFGLLISYFEPLSIERKIHGYAFAL